MAKRYLANFNRQHHVLRYCCCGNCQYSTCRIRSNRIQGGSSGFSSEWKRRSRSGGKTKGPMRLVVVYCSGCIRRHDTLRITVTVLLFSPFLRLAARLSVDGVRALPLGGRRDRRDGCQQGSSWINDKNRGLLFCFTPCPFSYQSSHRNQWIHRPTTSVLFASC